MSCGKRRRGGRLNGIHKLSNSRLVPCWLLATNLKPVLVLKCTFLLPLRMDGGLVFAQPRTQETS